MNPPTLIISIAVNSMRSLTAPFFSSYSLPPPYLQVPALFPQTISPPSPRSATAAVSTLNAAAAASPAQPFVITLPTTMVSMPSTPSAVTQPPSTPSSRQQQQQHSQQLKQQSTAMREKAHSTAGRQSPRPQPDWSTTRPAAITHVSAASMASATSSRPRHSVPSQPPPLPPSSQQQHQQQPQQVRSSAPRRTVETAELLESHTGENLMLERLTAIQASNVHAATRLDGVIAMLNALSGCFTAQNGLTFHRAIAELEQVKDMLIGTSASHNEPSPGSDFVDTDADDEGDTVVSSIAFSRDRRR